MTPYQVLVEGVFVDAPGTDYEVCGFHTTFYVMANNASNAAHRVGSVLSRRIDAHEVGTRESGNFRTYYVAHDIWEITDEKFAQNDGKDFGFAFFRIGRFEKYYLVLRYRFLRRLKPWLLIRRSP